MRLRILALAAALIGGISAQLSVAQNKADLKSQQKADEAAEQRKELLEEVQPAADRYAAAMVTRKCSDALVQGYISSLGESMVPPDTPASTTFSFRVVEDIYPPASALPDVRVYLTTGPLAHIENEAQPAMVLGNEIANVLEEYTLESLRNQPASQRRNKVVGAAVGALAATAVNSVTRSKFSREQEKEADLIGTELALVRGFDPEEEARFWDKQDERELGGQERPESLSGRLRARRVPNCGADVAFRPRGLVAEIVHDDHFAVRALDSAHVADVAARPVVAQNNLFAPCPSAIAAQRGTDAVGLTTVAVEQADSAILELDHRRGIADAGVRDGLAQLAPACAIVPGKVRLDPAPRPLPTASRDKDVRGGQPNRGRHYGKACGLRADPRHQIPCLTPIGCSCAEWPPLLGI